MIRYAYHLKNYRSWLKGFGRLLKLPVTDRRIEFPPNVGKGYILASNINDDISYLVMDFSLNEDFALHRKKDTHYGLTLLFSQVEVTDFFKLTTQHDSVIDNTRRRNNIFLSSTNYDLEIGYSAHSHLRSVSVLFSPQYVKRWIKKDILIDLMLFTGERLKNVNRLPITFEYRELLKDIFSTDMQSPISYLVLQNRILLLTEKFLHAFLEKSAPQKTGTGKKIKKEKEQDMKALRQVEMMLSTNILDKFPSIDVLSKTAMMSSTKLKTKFKQVYGMKLYEFYNRNRLEKAKEMLLSGDHSVKEAGYHIGFANLSNFAKAFKKEFGALPNQIVKNR